LLSTARQGFNPRLLQSTAERAIGIPAAAMSHSRATAQLADERLDLEVARPTIPMPTAETLALLVTKVTSTMLGFGFRVGDPRRGELLRFRLVLLTIGDALPVTLVLGTDQRGAAQLASRIFACAPEECDLGMMEDAMRELTNMAAGQVKNALALDAALGLPYLVEAPRLLKNGNSKWRRVTLKSEPMELAVWLSDNPSDWE
jgi:hypothetical protein